MSALFDEYLYQTLIGLFSVMLGVALLVNERPRSRATLLAAAFFVVIGLDAPVTFLVSAHHVVPADIGLGERLQVLLDVGAVFCIGPYLLALVQTSNAPVRVRRQTRALMTGVYVSAVVFGLLGIAFPAMRLNDYTLAVDGVDALETGGFWMFASVWLVIGSLLSSMWFLLSRQELDAGERTRAQYFAAASVLLTLAVPASPRVAITLYAACILLAGFGIIRYFGAQGERAAFLSRFLSPQVAELVRLHGLSVVTRPQELELSVVCIDFRGFTSYTEAVPTQSVIALIAEYHEAIGAVVARHDGLIKDYAGDGILVLLGAPIPRSDHAAAAVALATEALAAAHGVTGRWATSVHPLGVGIGIATGRVTVGAIGETARMEYTAVGTPVNLASRLCSEAADGQILTDEGIAHAAAGRTRFLGETSPKGLSAPTRVFELVGAAGFSPAAR